MLFALDIYNIAAQADFVFATGERIGRAEENMIIIAPFPTTSHITTVDAGSPLFPLYSGGERTQGEGAGIDRSAVNWGIKMNRYTRILSHIRAASGRQHADHARTATFHPIRQISKGATRINGGG